MRCTSTSLLMGLVLVMAGCANMPPSTTCVSCQPAPEAQRSAVAVSLPAICNDFPVVYRVNAPETTYVGPVERILLVSGNQELRPATLCGRAGEVR